ncbi:hypothetical protein LSM04_000214 [Trypanosoma melophagium]|uniref:uncharacterized protein n=1 Tax=Trypanosoma melophagium TaxID=715481 RepID=UPI00351A6E54|nr:hypothetical protein LSM04_000214 [Trypanosoma melophagium]
MISSWWVQYRAFLWKIALQRLRSPGTTLAELLLPCVFTLLLALGFWQSTTTHVPATDYSMKPPTDFSAFLPAFFCKNMSHPRPFGRTLPIGPCMPPSNATACFPFVRDGALCVRDRELMSKVMYGVYYAKGGVVVPSFDAYLALSAFATYEARRVNPTFMSRTGQAGLSHYGHLLLVGDGGNASVAAQFADYCGKASALCDEVVYRDHIFASMEEAQNFAKEHDGEVWAIAELPTPTKGSKGKGNIFTISMNYTATPWTFESSMPFTKGLGDNNYMLYVTSGFLTLQNAIQLFYVQRQFAGGKPPGPPSAFPSGSPGSPAVGGPSGIFEYVNLNGPALLPMPTTPYQNNDFYSKWAYFMPLIAMLAALFPVAKLVSWIVEEKSLRIRESMQIMGLRWSCMALGWFTSAFFTDVIASILAALVLRFSFFSYVDYGVLFFVYFSFMQQNSALSLFLSSLFTNPRIAGAVAALTIFVCCMPYYAAPNGMSLPRLFSISLLPCVAYAEAFNQLATYSSLEYSYTWSNTRDSDFSVAVAIGLMWASAGLFLILWMYLDQVLPSSIGRCRHPLFFLHPILKCLGICKRKEKRPSDDSEPRSPDGGAVKALPQQRAQLLDVSDERFPALFRNLRKVYETGGFIGYMYSFITGLRRDGDTCVAVKDVSFALERGKVNVLLGPNGSGKSSLMGMVTGMVKPTRGEVFICGHNAVHELSKCHQEIGYCPQSDIVWNKLTVEQHLAFYARLKNGTEWNVQERVGKMITALHLEEKRNTYAEDLSGGQRRRLCVAVSLIGNPKVLFLDEPTAGMDMRGRKAVYDAIQNDRDSRAVMISTHLLDEADRVGDRILLMQNGELCGAGSSLFLKSKMGVGYIVTCVVDACESESEENVYISRLTEFVRNKAYPGHYAGNPNELQRIPPECKLLGIERRGREISFRFSLSLLSSAGRVIIRGLEENREELHLRSIGLSLTTLQDVLDSVLEGEQKEDGKFKEPRTLQTSSGRNETQQGISIQLDGNKVREPFLGSPIAGVDGVFMRGDGNDYDYNSGNVDVGYSEDDDDQHYPGRHSCSFFRHFAALFMKRVHYGKRDVRLLVFQVLLPILFLGVALLIDLINPPNQPALVLDASLNPGYDSKPYSQVTWTASSQLPDVFNVSKSDMTKAFGPYYTQVKVPCDLDNCSTPLSSSMIPDLMKHTAPRHVAVSLTNKIGTGGRPSAVIMHNVSYSHAAGQSLNVLYNVVNHHLFGEDFMMTARNQPMPMGPTEEKMVGALRRVICGIFILLPFTFIPSNTVSFMVRENQSGSRHLQWLAGANFFAFWLSSMVFDFCCFLFTEALAMAIFVIFKRTEFIGNAQTVWATLALFSSFGLSSIPFSYVISFFFSSSFVAQNVVLIANFVFGFLWVMGEQIIGAVPSLEKFMLYTTYILRAIPSVSFGEGMFTLSGVELGNLFVPDRERPSLFNLLTFVDGKFKGGIGTGLIYMGCTFVVSLLVLVILEYARVQRFHWFFSRLFCCRSREPQTDDFDSVNVNDDVDNTNNNADEMLLRSVKRETAEVCAHPTGRPEDAITLRRVTKRYSHARSGAKHTKPNNNNNNNTNGEVEEQQWSGAALSDFTLGVHRGEIMALLGLNGAGKSTAVGVLAGSVVPTAGEAFINHHSVMRSASRRFVGYCPQKDALLDNLSPREHLTLYAKLRGASPAYIKREIPRLLHALGLADKHNRPAYALSGGNKRRLALAMALVGGTTSVLLDEPTAGMDAVARRQMCAVVRRLTKNKSVILTTHLLDESEALADRVAFMARGKLRCVGTPQELKTFFTDDAVYTVRVVFAGADDTQNTVNSLLTESLCKYFRTFDGEDAGGDCTLESVVGRTVTLLVRRSLSSICSITTAIREGALEGLPPVVQVSASQPTLEDILLRD